MYQKKLVTFHINWLRPIGGSLTNFLKSLFLCLILAGIGGIVVGSHLLLHMIDAAPPLSLSQLRGDEISIFFDSSNNLIDEWGQNRTWVELSEISPVMVDAILATEDAEFFAHPGVDWRRTIIANLGNINTLLGRGTGIQGGSTITQQLIKMTHLTPEDGEAEREGFDGIQRKIQEMYLSFQIEHILTKEQILTAYLNFAPFGGGIYGIQRASEFYFGVDASDLTLSQAATLAGIVQAPNGWRPDTNTDRAEFRRGLVLDMMLHHGFITPELRLLAMADPISDNLAHFTEIPASRAMYQPYIDAVLDELETRFGMDLTQLSGYQIFTNMDREAQVFLYRVQNGYEFNWLWQDNRIQTGISFLETQTGRVRAIGGGRGEATGERQLNFATGIGRMVGSTAKPLFPYAIGMEELGWGTGTGFYDEAFTWPTGGTVANWDNRFRGGVTLREAMNMSWNTPAAMGMVQVMNQIGQEGVNEWAQRFGLHVDGTGEPIENIHPAYALGGNTVGWSPLQMAAAYAIFGNGGYYHEPFFVDRVVSPEGEVTYGADMRVSQRVMSEETAYMITSTLRSTMTEGTGVNHANQGLWNMNLAGKTGTNGFGGPAEHAVVGRSVGAHIARDSWFVGFSGQFTTAVWVGYDRMRFGDYMEGFWAQGVSGRVFNQVMRNLNPWGTQLPARPWGIQGRQVEIPYDSGDNFLAVAPGDNVSNNYLRWELFNVNHPRFSITSRERDSSRVEEEEYEEYEYDYEYYDDGYDDGYEGYPADIPHDDGYVPAPDYGYETPAPAPYVPDDTPPPYETGYSDGY